MSIILDPDQAQHFVGLDLGPNYLQSFDQTSLEDRIHRFYFSLSEMLFLCFQLELLWTEWEIEVSISTCIYNVTGDLEGS